MTDTTTTTVPTAAQIKKLHRDSFAGRKTIADIGSEWSHAHTMFGAALISTASNGEEGGEPHRDVYMNVSELYAVSDNVRVNHGYNDTICVRATNWADKRDLTTVAVAMSKAQARALRDSLNAMDLS